MQGSIQLLQYKKISGRRSFVEFMNKELKRRSFMAKYAQAYSKCGLFKKNLGL
jgi:hypothetical protein